MTYPVFYDLKNVCGIRSRKLQYGFLFNWMAAACCIWLLQTTAGSAAEPQATGKTNLTVRDVSVYLVSAHGKKMNDASLFRSTLPGYMQSRRLSAGAEESEKPTPLGLITFEGPEVKDIDILVEFPSGRFLSHWPTARIQSRRIYWRSRSLLKSGTLSYPLPESSWLSPLQNAERLFVNGNNKCERFLLYDLEIIHAPEVTLLHTADRYQIQSREPGELRHLTIIQPTDQTDSWKLAAVDSVPGLLKQTPQAQTKTDQKPKPVEVDPLSDARLKVKAAAEKAKQLKALGNQLRNAGALPQLSPENSSDRKKTTAAGKKQTKVESVTVPYVDPEPVSRQRILDFWGKYLNSRGLGKPEITHLQRILSEYAFREDQATVVYCMDERFLEKSIPLEITPYPDVLHRTAIVILVDADPALQKQIDQLIAQLGDPVWAKREQAQKQLEEYGRAAQKQLQQAVNNKDLEIVFRSEQILEKIK